MHCQYLLHPTFTKEQIAEMDATTKLCRAFDETTYFSGVVGLNNIKANDYCNVVLHVPISPSLPSPPLAATKGEACRHSASSRPSASTS